MSVEEQNVEAELERLMGEVSSERRQRALDEQVQAELVQIDQAAETLPAVIEGPAPVLAAPANTRALTVSDAVFGYSFGERLRVIGAFAAGMTVASLSGGIMIAGAVAAAGYGGYAFFRWKTQKDAEARAAAPVDIDASFR